MPDNRKRVSEMLTKEKKYITIKKYPTKETKLMEENILTLLDFITWIGEAISLLRIVSEACLSLENGSC